MGFYTEKDIEIERLREENARLVRESDVLKAAVAEEDAAVTRLIEKLRGAERDKAKWKAEMKRLERERDEARAELARCRDERDKQHARAMLAEAEVKRKDDLILRCADPDFRWELGNDLHDGLLAEARRIRAARSVSPTTILFLNQDGSEAGRIENLAPPEPEDPQCQGDG